MENINRLVAEILEALRAENGVTIQIKIEPIRQTVSTEKKKIWVEKEVEEILIEKLKRLQLSTITINTAEVQSIVDGKNKFQFRRMHAVKALEQICDRHYGDYTLSDPDQIQPIMQNGFYYTYPKNNK